MNISGALLLVPTPQEAKIFNHRTSHKIGHFKIFYSFANSTSNGTMEYIGPPF